MNCNKLSALALALASTTSFAGAMGDVMMPERLLFLEGGFAYSHAFYNGRVTTAESITATNPNGYSINPKHFYPDDFFGGYIGSSLYMSNWLLNARLDMYGKKSKHNAAANTTISLAPAKLSFTVDRVAGNINEFSYGIGAGAVVENVNQGSAIIGISDDNPPSESIHGRSRMDPLVEGFLMYRFSNNLGVKFNAAYQIPLNNFFGNGDLNLNLGVNYAFPV